MFCWCFFFLGLSVYLLTDILCLADRSNGRAYATLLRLSSVVCYLWRYVLWLNGASRAKVTIESLHEVVYEKSIGTKMNDLDLCLEVISRSRQPLL